jgi:hypothetical protein
MSKCELHAPFTSFSGTIGKLVYRKYRRKTIVSMKPDADRPLSQAQTAHRQNFAQAAAWAKVAVKDQELGPFYEALGEQRDIPPYAAAVADFLKRPSIEALDLSGYAGQAGDQIYFMASDNAGLVNAMVTIEYMNGNIFENGRAVEVDPGTGYWIYTVQSALPASTTVRVKASASDRPGNVVELSEEKAF